MLRVKTESSKQNYKKKLIFKTELKIEVKTEIVFQPFETLCSFSHTDLVVKSAQLVFISNNYWYDFLILDLINA